MLVVIGKIENAHGKLEACRLVDTETMEIKDVSIKMIRNAVRRGVNIKGFALAKYQDLHSGQVKETVIKNKGHKFSWGSIPKLTGSGEVINPEDKKFLTVIGWKGFAEAKVYYLVDCEGTVTKLNIKEFIEKIKAKEVNGVILSKKGDVPLITEDLDIEIIE